MTRSRVVVMSLARVRRAREVVRPLPRALPAVRCRSRVRVGPVLLLLLLVVVAAVVGIVVRRTRLPVWRRCVVSVVASVMTLGL